MTLGHEILAGLFEEYRQNRDAVSFAKILKRVDLLLLKTIHRYTSYQPHLAKVSFWDLYQTSIVGLGRAILSGKSTEAPEKTTARIVSYVKGELKKTYPLDTLHRFCTFKLMGDSVQDCKPWAQSQEDRQAVEHNAELSMLRDKYKQMLADRVMSEEEFDLFVRRFGWGWSCPTIAADVGCSSEKIRLSTNRILQLMRENLENYEIV